MRKRPLGRTGLEVSELGLGTWGLSGGGYGTVEENEPARLIDRAVACGITLFETADCYGDGAMERTLGERIARDSPAILVTKIGTNRETVPPQKCFELSFLKQAWQRSQERLRRDPLDVVLLHNPSEKAIARGEATGFLHELRQSGKLRAWGVSVGSLEAARAAIRQGAQVLELAYNAFCHRDLEELGAELRQAEIGVLARSVLAYGLLCGFWPQTKAFAPEDHRALRWTPDELRRRIFQLNALRPCLDREITTLRSVGLRFVLSQDLVSCAVLGPRSSLQLDQLVREAGREPPYLNQTALEALHARLRTLGITG